MRKIDRRGENRCADFTTRVVWLINAVPKLDRTSMKQLGFKVRKSLQNMCDQRIRVATLYGKMKIDVPTSPQGVAVTKHRLRK